MIGCASQPEDILALSIGIRSLSWPGDKIFFEAISPFGRGYRVHSQADSMHAQTILARFWPGEFANRTKIGEPSTM